MTLKASNDMIRDHFLHIENFPKSYPIYKRMLAVFLLNVFGLQVVRRKNLLTNHDITFSYDKLRRGDIVLLGNLKTVFSSVLNDPVTHVALAVNKNKIIHSITSGVEMKPMKEVYKMYDTLAILRMKSSGDVRRKQAKKAVFFAKERLGEPYNFLFDNAQNSFFCSALVNDALLYAGYKTKLDTYRGKDRIFRKLGIPQEHIMNAMKPAEFMKGDFDVVFLSHNLRQEGRSLVFTEKSENILPIIRRLQLSKEWAMALKRFIRV